MSVPDRFTEAALAHPRPEFLREVRSVGAVYAAQPVCVHRTPLFLSAQGERAVRRALPPMHRLIRKIRAALLDDLDVSGSPLLARLGIPPDSMAWARIHPGFASVAPLARLDAYLVEGIPRFLELNAESPAGMGYAGALGPLVARDPAWALAGLRGSFVDPLPHVIRTVRAIAREYGITRSAFSVAVVDFRDVPTAPEFDLIAHAFGRAGHPCSVVDPRELNFDGVKLHGPEGPIDVVFRRLVVQDFREQPTECAALLAAYRAGAVCMVNSLRTTLLHNKGIFALLHDPTFPLAHAERRFVSRHIPRTLLLDDGAREEVTGDRENWVCKPVDGHGGRGVVLGWQQTRSAWEEALARPGTHIVQRRVSAPTGNFLDARDGLVHQRIVDLGPFLALGKSAGYLCRLAEGELANVTAGHASQVPVFTVASFTAAEVVPLAAQARNAKGRSPAPSGVSG